MITGLVKRSRVCILHVGGTIGMTATPEGLVPQPGVLERYLDAMPELCAPGMPEHHLQRLDPLRDSADMTPDDWLAIAQAIVERDADFDGFVVLHGTDTMVHTASALSFLLRGLQKPVVLTGSQLSLEHVRSDGREHIITSLIIAGTLPIPEVTIYFASRLLRGNRSQKVDNDNFVAFHSGNLPALATVGASISVATHLVRAPGEGLAGEVAMVRRPQVGALRVFPGITPAALKSVLTCDGLVLETYGAGTFPVDQPGLLDVIRESSTVVVNCTQCHGGMVRQDLYRSGRLLEEAGVTSGSDMTPEAGLTKLYCLFAQGCTPAEARAQIGVDLAGELTPFLTAAL